MSRPRSRTFYSKTQPTNPPHTAYREIAAALCELVSVASRKGVETSGLLLGELAGCLLLPHHCQPIWMISTSELHCVLKKLRRRKLQHCYQSLLMCLLRLPMAWGAKASSNMRSKQMKVSLSSVQRAVTEVEIQNMLRHGVIELSSSPWASPIVVLCKKGPPNSVWIIAGSTLPKWRTLTHSPHRWSLPCPVHVGLVGLI